MPRKVFTAGEVLAAADVNSFLMDQTVMTFAGTAARGSAIGTAVEGMVTWLNDENALQVYDGTQWNGLAASGGNAIINGAFEINQRGLTSSTAGGYGFDRWTTLQSGGTVTSSSQAFTLGAAPVAGFEAANFYRVVTAGQSASGNFAVLSQAIEGVRSFAGQTITVSFYAKSGAGTPQIGLELSQFFGTGGSPSARVSTPFSATISTSWTRYTATVAVPSISGKTIGTDKNDSLQLLFWISAGSDFATRASSIGIQNNTFDIWGVQLEAGPTANVFRRNANSLAGELAACQRYFQRFVSGADATNEMFAIGQAYATTAAFGPIQFFVPMRATPTMTISAAGHFGFTGSNGSDLTLTALTLTASNTTARHGRLDYTVASGLTAGNAGLARSISASSTMDFSAEL